MPTPRSRRQTTILPFRLTLTRLVPRPPPRLLIFLENPSSKTTRLIPVGFDSGFRTLFTRRSEVAAGEKDTAMSHPPEASTGARWGLSGAAWGVYGGNTARARTSCECILLAPDKTQADLPGLALTRVN